MDIEIGTDYDAAKKDDMGTSYDGLFSPESMLVFLNQYFLTRKHSMELEKKFRDYVDRTFLQISSMLLVTLAFLVTLSWPVEYLIFDNQNILFWFNLWHGGSLILFLLLLLLMSLVKSIRPYSKSIILVGLLIALPWIGFCLAQASKHSPAGSPWFYSGLVYPFFTFPMPFRFWKRIASTVLVVLSYLLVFMLTYPEFFEPAYMYSTLIVNAGTVILSVIFGHVFYQLTRTKFFNEKKLEYIATHDQLTSLLEPEKLDENLADTITGAQRYGYGVSLMMLDLDHFKQVNDTHGHAVGNTVLETFGEIIGEQVRDPDIPARYGGEEFTIVLPHTSKDDARHLANRIQEALKNHLFKSENGEFHITCSIGIAGLKDSDEDPTDLLERSDKALYEAKESGRNCVVVK